MKKRKKSIRIIPMNDEYGIIYQFILIAPKLEEADPMMVEEFVNRLHRAKVQMSKLHHQFMGFHFTKLPETEVLEF